MGCIFLKRVDNVKTILKKDPTKSLHNPTLKSRIWKTLRRFSGQPRMIFNPSFYTVFKPSFLDIDTRYFNFGKNILSYDQFCKSEHACACS